jgi:hypothetical protein
MPRGQIQGSGLEGVRAEGFRAEVADPEGRTEDVNTSVTEPRDRRPKLKEQSPGVAENSDLASERRRSGAAVDQGGYRRCPESTECHDWLMVADRRAAARESSRAPESAKCHGQSSARVERQSTGRRCIAAPVGNGSADTHASKQTSKRQ